MREALVRHAMPQKSWPTVAIRTTSFAAHGSSALPKIAVDQPRPKPFEGSLMNLVSVAAKVIASSTNQPITPAQSTERRAPRLLADMRGGVVPGLRVHRQQEADRQHVEPEHPHAEAGVVDALGEDEVDALVVRRDDDQDPDHDCHADDVPPDGDVV